MRHKTRLVLCEAQPNALKKLKVTGMNGKIGTDHVLENLHQINHREEDIK